MAQDTRVCPSLPGLRAQGLQPRDRLATAHTLIHPLTRYIRVLPRKQHSSSYPAYYLFLTKTRSIHTYTRAHNFTDVTAHINKQHSASEQPYFVCCTTISSTATPLSTHSTVFEAFT